MNWSKSIKGLVIASGFLLGACYPEGAEFYSDTDVVFTNYTEQYDFKSKGTFAIPDRIVKITGDVIDGEEAVFIPDAIATAMIARISQNLVSLGYTKVDISQNPDLILAPAAIESTTVVYWYDYWGWYWGGYYPGWGYPGYPYYPYYPSYSTYSTGTLVMSLIDPDVTSASGNPVSQWVGAVAGLLSYSYDANRVNKVIDQAFAQSPYLKTN